MVPAFREIVEACFELNLLAVVFATETLALGVNMPARSVALEKFTKYSDAGRKFLTSGEFSQMTGRAGRRGLDDEGHAIVCFANEVALPGRRRAWRSPRRRTCTRHSARPTTSRRTSSTTSSTRRRSRSSSAPTRSSRPIAVRPGDKRPLGDQMVARHHVLEELGYAEGWRLTASGQLLRSIYHECDLLIAESINAGVFEELEPAQLAGLLSCFVYESKRAARAPNAAKQVTTKKKRSLNDRLGQERRGNMNERLAEITVIGATIREIEGPIPGSHREGARRQVRHHHRRLGQGSVARHRARPRRRRDRPDLAGGLRAQRQAGGGPVRATGPHEPPRPRSPSVALEARDAVLRSVVAGASSVHPRA